MDNKRERVRMKILIVVVIMVVSLKISIFETLDCIILPFLFSRLGNGPERHCV